MTHTTGVGGSASLHTILGSSDRVSNEVKIAQAATTAKAGISSPDKAALSSTGGTLAKTALQDTDDVQTAKVAQIQKAIADGSYQVPASAVADKLIQHLRG